MWGDSLFELGQRSLAAARRATDQSQKAKFLAEARNYFKQAGSRYGDAQDRFLARFAQLTPDEAQVDRKTGAKIPAISGERQEMELGAVRARFKLGLVKYHLAETYDDPKAPERTELLKAAAKGFDDIFQQYRLNAEDERCIVARLWHGKSLEELGDEQTALDDFDEVLAGDTSAGETALTPIYTQATFFRYGILRKQGKIDALVAEGSKWAELRKSWAKYPYFNGAVLELARAYQAQAEQATGESQRKILQKAAILLADSAKIDSPYKSDILLLRRDIWKQLGTENLGAAEFLALGDVALRENNLADATKNYEQARQKALDAKDQKAAEEAKLSLSRVSLMQAQTLFEKKKYEEALQAAEIMAQGDPADPSTVGAAELALRSAFFLGATSPDKEDAYARLEKTADFVKNKWSGRPVADEARMILAQSFLQKGDTAAALSLFGQVKPESSRYPWALFNIGRIEWLKYLDEKNKGGGGNEKAMAEAAAKARLALQKCAEMLQRSLAPGSTLTGGENDDPSEAARTLQLQEDVQLLQSEIYLDGKEYRKAAEILEPLAEKIKLDSSKANDAATAVFVAAIRACLALGEADKAAEYALALLAHSEDEPRVNSKLVNIAKLLNQELKTKEAAVAAAQGGEPQKIEAATAKRDAFKERMRKLIEPLGKRNAHSLSDLFFLGDACFNLNLADEGGQIYQNLLDRAKDDPAFAKKSEKVLVFARSQLVGALRSQGKLDEALQQVDELVAKNPNVLSPKMIRADILEDLAKQDPKKLEDAILQWNEVRQLLGRESRKRPEYFDVIYKIAKGLYRQYETSRDKSKLDPAEQLLQTTLIQYSKLSGPDMVAKYNDLLKKIVAAKGKK